MTPSESGSEKQNGSEYHTFYSFVFLFLSFFILFFVSNVGHISLKSSNVLCYNITKFT